MQKGVEMVEESIENPVFVNNGTFAPNSSFL